MKGFKVSFSANHQNYSTRSHSLILITCLVICQFPALPMNFFDGSTSPVGAVPANLEAGGRPSFQHTSPAGTVPANLDMYGQPSSQHTPPAGTTPANLEAGEQPSPRHMGTVHLFSPLREHFLHILSSGSPACAALLHRDFPPGNRFENQKGRHPAESLTTI